MRKITLYIGLNDKDNHNKKHNKKTSKEFIADKVNSLFFGCSIIEALGLYTYEDGTKDKENSLVVNIITDDNLEVINNKIKYLVTKIKKELNQESIMVEITENYIIFM